MHSGRVPLRSYGDVWVRYKSKPAASRPNARCALSGFGRNLRACGRLYFPNGGVDFPEPHRFRKTAGIAPRNLPKNRKTHATHVKHTRRAQKAGYAHRILERFRKFCAPRAIGIQIWEAGNATNYPEIFPKLADARNKR